MTAQELALALLTAVFTDYDPEAARVVLAPDYIQHNAIIPSGADGLINLIPVVKENGVGVTTHRVIVDGDYVVTHNTFNNADVFGAAQLASFDVFRIEDGLLAEHWDNLQPQVLTTVSGRSMTDGPTEITDLEKTAANKAVVEGFVTDVFLGGDLEKAADYIASAPGAYHQHNPTVADGLTELGEALMAKAQMGLGYTISKLHMTIAEGNFVLTVSEGKEGDTPTAFYDLWRVEDGMIVEHWDVIAEIPAEMAHENGKF